MSLAATLALNVPAITALCTGPRGPQGATILTGSGAPLTANGNIGDVYIDVQNSFIYGPKPLSSSWGSAQTLTTSVSTIFTPLVLSAYNFVSYTNYYSGAPLTYASTGQDLTYTPLTLMGYTSSYLQSYIQNFSSSVSASTDIVAANNIGAYIDLGINSSNYNGNLYTPTFNICGANDSYLYNSFGNMTIGTGSNAGGDFIIFTNGTLSGTHGQGGNESLRVKANGNIGIGTQFPNQLLTVVGNISATNNISTSSINSNVGVFNNALSVSGTISATTINTTSISATGVINADQGYGTRGSLGAYTYLDRNGNGTAGAIFRQSGVNQLWDNNVGTVIAYTSAGSVGIGTTTPNQTLTVIGNISANGTIYGNTGFNYQTGTSYTLVPTDNGTVIGINNSLNATVYTNGFTPIPGFQVGILQLGAGRLTVSPTPNQANSFSKTRTQYSAATLLYTGSSWVMFGDVAA